MRRVALLLAPATALLLAACAGAPPPAPPAPGAAVPAPVPPPAPAQPAAIAPGAPAAPAFAALAARFTDRALQQEKAGDLHQALESWKVVAALRPAAEEPRRRVADLGARTAAEAARRYAAGVARLEKGETDAARRELLLALAADPGHAGALDALRNRLEPHAVTHTVAAGETFAAIAKRHYGDEAQAALVARLNELDPAAAPVAGTVLLIPALPPMATGAAAKRGASAAETVEAHDEAYETEPAAIAPEAAPAPAAAPPAAAPAPAAPRQPDPAVELRRRREKAEEFYTAGVRHYLDQRLDEAIRAWEQTLALYPEHPKAPKDIEKARALQQKLRDLR